MRCRVFAGDSWPIVSEPEDAFALFSLDNKAARLLIDEFDGFEAMLCSVGAEGELQILDPKR